MIRDNLGGMENPKEDRDTTSVYVRLLNGLIVLLDQRALEENRSRANLIETLLIQAMREWRPVSPRGPGYISEQNRPVARELTDEELKNYSEALRKLLLAEQDRPK